MNADTLNSETVQKLAKETYYLNPEMIRFLVIENLALKTLLHEKGMLNMEEFSQHKAKATEMLDNKVQIWLDRWQASDPMVKLLKTLEKPTQSNAADSSASS